CIVRWPGRVPKNRVSDAIFATIDFMPTFATLAGFKVPADRIIDGVDQTELIFGQSEKGARDTFYYQGNGVRRGKWKYLTAKHQVPRYARDATRAEVEELYDLDADIGETTNLAEEHPVKVKELRALLEEIRGKG
ncbi:MAG: N-acetylgalactosamine 6-sulfate sulfatase, partial [Planctomycetes bacterium]|nr:N-acetylgalactosamine 6-sulfate sulfatase [Planctomycetota bacterium]